MSKISFIKSDDRKYNVERCLSLLKSEIVSGLRDAKKIVVMPYCPNDQAKFAATNVDALAATLKFIRPFTKAQINLAAGVNTGNTLAAFKNFGYLSLQEEYDFTITDLNNDDFEQAEILDKKGNIQMIKIARTITESDYLISVSPPRAHNLVVYSGAIDSVSTGSLAQGDSGLSRKIISKLGISKNNKEIIYQDNHITHENIKRLYKHVPIKLAILDGFELMQGDGPINGEMAVGHFALASSDPLAADWLACQVMGIDINDVGYLKMLDDEDTIRSDYFVIGDTWQKYTMKLKMSPNFSKIKNWQLE